MINPGKHDGRQVNTKFKRKNREYIKRNRDKIRTQTCYDSHNFTLIFHNMSVSQWSLRSFLCNPLLTYTCMLGTDSKVSAI